MSEQVLGACSYGVAWRSRFRWVAIGFFLLTARALPAAEARRPVADLACEYAFEDFAQSATRAHMRNSLFTVDIEGGSRKLTCNNVLIWLNSPCLPDRGGWTLAKCDVSATLDPLLRPASATSGPIRIVVLDPGHGGEDSGAVGAGRVCEKKVTLDLASRVAAKLRDSGVVVRMTRTADVACALPDRTHSARRWGADLFVSIHLNSSRNRNASGVETYVLPAPGYPGTASTRADWRTCPGNSFDAQNSLLAFCLQKGLLSQTGFPDRGVKRARFEVLTQAPCPAALVECCFVSHGSEGGKMKDPDRRDAVADGIARGIFTYISRTEPPPPPLPEIEAPVAAR